MISQQTNTLNTHRLTPLSHTHSLTLKMADTAFPSPGPKITTLLEYILEKYEVLEPGLGTVPTVESMFKDEELQRMIINMGLDSETKEATEKKVIKKKVINKKSSPKKKVPENKEDRNKESFSEDRCCARKWEAEKGLGYDNIQCSSCKKISKEDAEKTLEEFKDKMTEEHLKSLPGFLEAYDGCYCKNHLKMDFFMPGGWWLGKVNEPRPEKPMLPKGSFKDGYVEDYKEHRWMYGPDGEKVEKTSKKKIIKKKVLKKKVFKKKEPKVEEKVEAPAPVEEPKVEEKVEAPAPVQEEPKVEENLDDPVPEEPQLEIKETIEIVKNSNGTETEIHRQELVPVEKVEEQVDPAALPPPHPDGIAAKKEAEQKIEDDGEETEDMSDENLDEDEEDYEPTPYEHDGVEYLKVWDEDEHIWGITDTETGEIIGTIGKDGIFVKNDE